MHEIIYTLKRGYWIYTLTYYTYFNLIVFTMMQKHLLQLQLLLNWIISKSKVYILGTGINVSANHSLLFLFAAPVIQICHVGH